MKLTTSCRTRCRRPRTSPWDALQFGPLVRSGSPQLLDQPAQDGFLMMDPLLVAGGFRPARLDVGVAQGPVQQVQQPRPLLVAQADRDPLRPGLGGGHEAPPSYRF